MKSVLKSVALAAALCAAASANAAPVLTFTPATSQIAVGETVVIDATISGLGAEVISAFDLNFLFDANIVEWMGDVYFGANLGNNLGLGNAGSGVGNLGRDDASLDDDATLSANQADSFLLFQFTFKGKADGTTNFTLGANVDFERLFTGLNFSPITVDVGSACIAVGRGDCGGGNPVPEPATFGLAAIALLTAGVARRRARKAA